MNKPNGLAVGAGIAALGVIALIGAARADSLREALTDAYGGNATIQAQRYQQRQTDEQLPQAQSGWHPSVSLSGSIVRGHQYFGFPFPGVPPIQDVTPRTAELSVSQPLYRGGETEASIDRAYATIAAGVAQLQDTEEQQLLAAASAYLDVFRDRSVVDLANYLVEVLKLNQHDVQTTYNAGAATETDTSQAVARLAGASASVLAADAALKTSQARFRAVVGRDVGDLTRPETLGSVPANEAEALSLALANNPQIVASKRQREAAEHQVDVARAALFPKVDAVAQLLHQDDDLIKGIKFNDAQIGFQATVPLYQGGAAYAQIRAAKEAVRAADAAVDAAERAVTQEVTTAWNALEAARAQSDQYRSAISANDIALRDTGKEVNVGTRTRLDVLNAQQELFGSRVDLVRAEHDIFYSTFALETAAGVFTPSKLGLDVPEYDPARHLDEVDGKWWGVKPPAD